MHLNTPYPVQSPERAMENTPRCKLATARLFITFACHSTTTLSLNRLHVIFNAYPNRGTPFQPRFRHQTRRKAVHDCSTLIPRPVRIFTMSAPYIPRRVAIGIHPSLLPPSSRPTHGTQTERRKEHSPFLRFRRLWGFFRF